MSPRNLQILVELQDWMGDDAAVANAGWTSTYDKAKRDARYDDPEKVRDLIENKLFGQEDAHNVPVESVILRFWIRMPIFADRQHMTHRIQSANGLSGRYRTMPLDYLGVPVDVQVIFAKATEHHRHIDLTQYYQNSCQTAINHYETTIATLKLAEKHGQITNAEYKRAREIARGQLPTAGMTERTTIMNLAAFANYQRKRNSEHAQPEIRQVAQMMLEQVEAAGIAPITIACLKKRGWKL